MNKVFLPADILLPANADMEKWSIIACDQFSSQPEYWETAEKLVGDEPSTLRLMLPEAYLEKVDQKESTAQINKTMRDYVDGGVFTCLADSIIYVERVTSDGRVRRGLVGRLDLEEYEYTSDSKSLVRASEETVVSRLPARIELRGGAAIELPHTMVLIDDPENTVIFPFGERKDLEKVYDFDLMQGGGHITGWKLGKADAEKINSALEALLSKEKYAARYGADITGAPVLCVVGDGNHSLAAAKACWDSKKESLSAAERETDPARFSLVELVNIHDTSLDFAPIHRVVTNTDAEKLLAEFKKAVPADGDGGEIVAVLPGRRESIKLPTADVGTVIRTLQDFLDQFTKENGGKIDYIHGDDALVSLVRGESDIGFMLPPLSKSGLFRSVIASGVLPRKSFSMGQARDKRYYLECRKIVK